MSISRNTYRMFNRAKTMAKHAACGAVMGAVAGEILLRMNDESKPEPPVEYDCLKWTLKPQPYAFANAGIGGAIGGLILLGILNLSLIGICKTTESVVNVERTQPQLFMRMASSLLGAGIGLVSGYYKDIPELGEVPIDFEQSQSHSGRMLK